MLVIDNIRANIELWLREKGVAHTRASSDITGGSNDRLLGQILNGKVKGAPHLKTKKKIAAYFGKTVEQLERPPVQSPLKSIQLSDGRIAYYEDPITFKNRGWKDEPVTAIVDIEGQPLGLYEIGLVRGALVLYPDGEAGPAAAIPYDPDGEWNTGVCQLAQKKCTARIVGIVDKVTTQYNTHFFQT